MGRTRPSREDLVRRNAELKEKRKRIKEGSTLPAGQRKPGVASPAAPAARGLAAPVQPPPVPEATMAPSAPEGVPPKAASSSVKGQVPAGVEGQSDRRQEPEPEPLAELACTAAAARTRSGRGKEATECGSYGCSTRDALAQEGHGTEPEQVDQSKRGWAWWEDRHNKKAPQIGPHGEIQERELTEI